MILAVKNLGTIHRASVICDLLHMYYFLLLSLACHLRLLMCVHILGWPKIMKYIQLEIVPRGRPTFWLMNSRGRPPFGGLYVDEF